MQPTVNEDKPKKPGVFTRLKAWIHANPKRTYIVVGLGIIIAANLIVLAAFWQQPKKVEPSTKITGVTKHAPSKPHYYSPLTGEEIASEADASKPVTAIMIENSPDARPQSGLKDAEVVYEAVAEGGITRFIAVYQQHKPQLIGPVRSLRMYYLDWATPYDASIAHVGGSLNALNTVRNGSYRDIDQFFNGGYYWRATDRYAPHNVYTSFEKLDQLNSSKGYTTSHPVGLERQAVTTVADNAKKSADDTVKDAPAAPTANTINLTISGPLYNSSYTYDPATKLYSRSEGGAPHQDREAGQITAKVVVALRVNMTQVLEDGYRESITTTGTGEAVIFQNGQVLNATWHKDSQTAQLTFTDSTGQPIKLARGTTWISAVPISGGDVSWQ